VINVRISRKNSARKFSDEQQLYANFAENCIPRDVFSMDIQDYKEFLNQRRELMARKIKLYYYSL